MDGYNALYQRSIQDPDGFWADEAKELTWFQPWTKVVDESKKPFFRWFVDGKTNVAYNCLDAQVAKGLGDKVAIVYEGEPTADGKAALIMRHVISNRMVELTGKDAARGSSYVTTLIKTPDNGLALLSIGRYEDEYVRRGGVWRIAKRRILLDIGDQKLGRQLGF